jgi:hypothetical protein
MIIRFVQGTHWTSKLIIAQERTAMPFTPSHAEAVMPNGRYLGAHQTGGVQECNPGYDAEWVPKDKLHELFLTLPAMAEQDAVFYDYLRKHIGEPYDWRAITGFVVPGHYHDLYHTICSALITGGLRTCEWFPFPLTIPWHLVDPARLLLMISVKMQVPM